MNKYSIKAKVANCTIEKSENIFEIIEKSSIHHISVTLDDENIDFLTKGQADFLKQYLLEKFPNIYDVQIINEEDEDLEDNNEEVLNLIEQFDFQLDKMDICNDFKSDFNINTTLFIEDID